MLPRKYSSGSEKRKKRKRIDALVKSQSGALDKFFKTSSSMEEGDMIENVEDDALNENDDLNEHDDLSDSDDLNKHNKVIVNENEYNDLSEKERWKLVLVRIVGVVKYLVKHNLSYRGDNESAGQNNNGIFMSLLELIAEFDLVMQQHFRCVQNKETHYHYLSHKIQKELVSTLASNVRSSVIEKIKEAKYYSVILDCTIDADDNEQMALLIRCVDMSGSRITVEELFIKFLKVDNTSGLVFFNELQSTLESLELDIDNVRGQCYDNRSNIKGKRQGVQKRFLEINPRAFYMPCACHSLTLTICDMINSSVRAFSFFGVVQCLYTLFVSSTTEWKILQDRVHQLTLESFSTRRWESDVNSIEAIITQPDDIIEALFELSRVTGNAIITSKANSLVHELENFEFLLGMTIWHNILNKVHSISTKLQSEDIQIDGAIITLKDLISYFEAYREEGFESAMTFAKELASKMEIDPIFPKKCKSQRTKQFDKNCHEEISLSAEESFRINYFIAVVDITISSLKSRLEQLEVFEDIFGFLFNYKKLSLLDEHTLHGCCVKLQDALKYNDKLDIDADDLCSELQILQKCLPKKINSIIEVLEFVKTFDCLPNVSIAYRILMTIPLTVSPAEKSSSKINLIKTYVRSLMSQEMLNELAILNIENEILDELDFGDIIDDFATRNAGFIQ